MENDRPRQTKRINFHGRLEAAVHGITKLYFQKPPSKEMVYPCIVYTLNGLKTFHADNRVYLNVPQYTVTHITEDPDDEAFDDLVNFPYSSFDRHFTSDGLHHNVFTIFDLGGKQHD